MRWTLANMNQKDNPYFRATNPFVCQGKKQFVTVDDEHQTVRRRIWSSGAILDEIVCPNTSCGCSIDEIAASPSGSWLVTQRHSGQGEWGYDVFRTCPLTRVAGVSAESGYMIEIPRFSDDETRVVGGFGSRWLGGWWAHDDDDLEIPARGGPVTFGFLLTHHLPSHRVDRHELRIELPKAWLPDDPENEIWFGASAIVPDDDAVSMKLYGGVDFKIAEPLPSVIVLPTPHPSGKRVLGR